MLYITLFLTSILLACSPYPDLSALRDAETITQSVDSGLLKLEPKAFENAGEAGILVSWNLDPAELGEGLVLFRVTSTQREFVKEVSTARGLWMDSALQDGTEYVYELLAADGSLRGRAQTRTGLDWVVTGEERLPQNYADISRLFFAPNAVLVTEGLPLDWKLTEIRGAPGARWVSFLKDRPATPGYAARTSGSGRVEVKRASGDLRVEWRGETGARGRNGLSPSGRGARGGNGSSGRSGIDRCSNGSRGAPGGPGLMGLSGEKGENGGDVESLEFVLLYPDSNFQLQVIAEPGIGGPGGLGGPGGRGGEGGKGGSGGGIDCSDGPAGPEGPPGAAGTNGESGNDGQLKGQVCVRRGEGGGCSGARGVLESRS